MIKFSDETKKLTQIEKAKLYLEQNNKNDISKDIPLTLKTENENENETQQSVA